MSRLSEEIAARLEPVADRIVWSGICVLRLVQRMGPMRTTGLKIERLLEAYAESVELPPAPPPGVNVTRAPWQREQRDE